MEKLTLTLSDEAASLVRERGGRNLSRWVDQAIRDQVAREDMSSYRRLTDALGINDDKSMGAAMREREEIRRAAR
ncbi:MAG: hypothetical protein ACRDUA_02305 [Micromonosporaceae bacterium]